MAKLLVEDKTGGTITGYWYRKRQVVQLLVTGTGKDRWYNYWLLVQEETNGKITAFRKRQLTCFWLLARDKTGGRFTGYTV